MQAKNEREEQTEERSGDGDDDFVERSDLRQTLAIDIHFAFDDVHRRELRQGDETAKRDRAERVLHAVDRLLPERFPKPDAKLFDHQTAPAGGEEVPQLMHDDEQIKKDNDLEEDEKDAEDMHDDEFLIRKAGKDRGAEVSTASFFPDSIPSKHGRGFSARPLIGGEYRIQVGVRNRGVAIHDLLDKAPDAGEWNSLFKEG